MMNRVVGNQTMCKVGNPHRTIWRAGSQCRTCDYNSTSGLVSVLTTLLWLPQLNSSPVRPNSFKLAIILHSGHFYSAPSSPLKSSVHTLLVNILRCVRL